MSVQNGFTLMNPNKKKAVFERLKKRKSLAYYREGSFSSEIIWDDRKFLFPSNKKSFYSNMWIFRAVLREAKEYIADKRIREKEPLPVNLWNPVLNISDCSITATDVNHAYWRIAYLEGIISEKTYFKGLAIKDKSLKLAALANLRSAKEYFIVENGIVTNKTKILRYDPILHKLYDNIRYTCYEHMQRCADILGDDFICYKTDCIYYIDTANNRRAVQLYLDTAGFDFKQLSKPKIKEIGQ